MGSCPEELILIQKAREGSEEEQKEHEISAGKSSYILLYSLAECEYPEEKAVLSGKKEIVVGWVLGSWVIRELEIWLQIKLQMP